MAHVCFYDCCSDCVAVCGNICCVAAVVKDSGFFNLGVLKYVAFSSSVPYNFRYLLPLLTIFLKVVV